MASESMDQMEGVEMTKYETPLLTEQEKRVLEMYDRLEELQLEIALLKAQGILSQDTNGQEEVSEDDIKAAEQELLQAKSLYQVRSDIIENVLIANPVVKAVHAGNNASAAEQDLLPLLQQRDDLSIKLTQLSSQSLAVRNELIKVQSENIIISEKNAQLAATMMALAKEASTQKKEDIEDPKARARLDELEKEMKASRQRWRIMKGTASAAIVGSGVDWARDPKLLEIVLDKDD